MDRFLSRADFEEIKEYHALIQACWARPSNRELVLGQKFQNVDLLIIMIQAFEKAELEIATAKDAVKKYLLERDPDSLAWLEKWSKAND